MCRPQYVMFPKDSHGFAMDDQFYVGDSLLVKPVTQKDVTETTVYLAEDQVYYDYFTSAPYAGSAKGKTHTIPVDLDTLPLFIRGGSVISTRERPRRSAPLMAYDPFTLRVALAKDGYTASGELYLDNGETYDYENGDYVWRRFVAEKSGKKGLRIKSERAGGEAKAFEESLRDKEVRVERVVVLGFGKKPKAVKIGDKDATWEYEDGMLSIKDPKVLVVDDWSIVVEV